MLYFMKDISMSEKSDHHILNFKTDRSHSDSTARNEREVDEITLANISIIPEPNESSLNKPTSLRAFVQFDNPFTEKVKDIFVTLRWNQPEFNDEIIQGYQVQCSFFEDFKEICDDKNITAKKLEHTMHNLIFNTTYYFRVRAHTKIVAGPYTDLINVSTTHENPIPKFLVTTYEGIEIFDLDLNDSSFIMLKNVRSVAYSIQEHRIYWIRRSNLMTLKINEKNITKIASFDYDLNNLCIDWVARNLYFTYSDFTYFYIVKFDLTMWENDRIVKFEEIFKAKNDIFYLNVLPSMGILYFLSYNRMNSVYMMQQYHLDGKNEQIRLNEFFPYIYNVQDMIIDNMNNETPLIYWITTDRIFVTDIIVSTYNQILHNRDISDNMTFETMTIDKTNIYILSYHASQYILYVLNKKYVSLKKVNAAKYIKKINLHIGFQKFDVFDKSSQLYPPMRCLTPYEKVYNFENVNATANGIIVNFPESVVKRGCKKYNLPTTIYTISVSCVDNNLNKSEKFNVLTVERYYEIQNLAPFTEYKLKFTLSNFYFDQLSINPFDSNVILIKTNSSKLNAPENISVLALTPTIAVVHWIPLKKVYCVAVTYEVHWKSVTLVNGTQQKRKQMINMPKRTADGRFFTKIKLSLPVQDYLIYVRVYPNNFSDFYNESLSKIVHIYSEPNNITLNEVDINSMDISWISNINLTVPPTLEYKENATEKWQTTNYIKINYNKKNEEIIYHIENLKSGTLYKFRLILRYSEYEENFTWPADERFIFSTFESSWSKPTSLRAFVQFDSQFTGKVNDIYVTLRWNQPEFTDEIIQGYHVQCSFFEDFKETCDDKNITTRRLEHTVHNLIFNTTYYFRVRAHTKIVAGPYTDLIKVSTTHENPIPKLLVITDLNMEILDVDLRITNILMSGDVRHVAYSIQEHIIYWSSGKDLMTLKIDEYNITQVASFDYYLYKLCIDWVARNLYFTYEKSDYNYIVKFDLTMWENGIIKFEEIFKSKNMIKYLNVLSSMGTLYFLSHNWMNNVNMMQQYHPDGKSEQIRLNEIFPYIYSVKNMIIDNMNNETPLIYWLTEDRIFVTDIIVSTYNQILHNTDISDNILFQSMTIEKTNIYILCNHEFQYIFYVLNKKYVSLKRINAVKYVKKINSPVELYDIYVFDKSSQPYPPMRCLTPYEKVYNFENVNATANSIIVNLPESVVKRGCKKYNLPTTIYTISVSCLDNNLNKSEKFNVLTDKRYYEIQNLAPFTEYKLKFTLSNFYFDQLSINPFDSNVILIKTNSSKLNVPENITVLALTPTIAVVHWMPLKKVYCVAVTYEVHWKSVTLVNDTQQKSKQLINMPKRTADGRFFTKINLSLLVQDYLIYVRVYPNNFSDFYNESLSIVHRYSEPNDIILNEVDINSMNISWISNINLTIFFRLEYKDIAAEKWQTMNYTKMNYNNTVIYHVENLQSETLYKFRMILRYPEYEENFTWPADERFIFSTFESLSKPTSLRAFVQFDSQFTGKINDIYVTLRWNQREFNDKIILEYQVQCSLFEDFKETCDDKTITATKLEHTVHNLTSNTTYYFRVRAHTKIVAGPYTDLINVSTTHENPIPKLLIGTIQGLILFDLDLNIFNLIISNYVQHVAYWIQEHIIYWSSGKDLMTLKIDENNITKIASFDFYLYNFYIDWVARNLYFIQDRSDYPHIVKFDLTMWENYGIIKFDEIFKSKNDIHYVNVLPSMGILYFLSHNRMNNVYMMQQYHLDGKNEQIRLNEFFPYIYSVQNMIIDNMNETPLIYWLTEDRIFVTDIIVSTYNEILHNADISDNILFLTMTIDKTNIYIAIFTRYNESQYTLYALNKKYVSLKRTNAAKYVKKVIIKDVKAVVMSFQIQVFDKALQPYPPMRCLTPYEKVYNFENVNATANSIIVNLSEPVVKRGCKKYNLPTTVYTISVNHCLDNNLNKSEKFNMLRYVTSERYYEIQNLTPFTEYKMKFTLSNFYFDKLSINPIDSNVIPIKTNSGKLNEPEDISVLALTPIIAVVHWMPPKELNCVVVTYEVHWKSITLVNDMQQENKQFINMPKHMTDGRFFTKINLSLPVQYYLIYVRVYPMNFSDFYNESLNKIVHRYSEPNDIILSGVNINSMNISWISNINLTVSSRLEYKEIAAEKWRTTNYSKMNYNNEVIYHVENLQSGTLYKFRLILRYPEYEENFTWPADERFIFSTRGSKHDILSTPEIIAKKYYLFFMLSFIVIVTVICICYFYYLHRQHRGNNEQFLSSTMIDMELAILHEVSYAQFIYNMLHCNPDKCAITKIARKQITLTKRLGSGAFGMVFQGNVKNLEGSGTDISVAIKTLRKDASSHEKKNLLKEANLMNHFRHKHIIRLLAVCLDGDSPLLVLELMETDLLKYLRECRNLQASDSPALRLQDLLAMCEDVARGCCYLEELRFVHRDLACRNCLVSSTNRENRVIKIGDFGLARDIYTDDYYRMKGDGLLPIRWMAPESLMIDIFTSQSDVWSFGVLMWEITSLGEKPYSDKTDKEVIYHVRAGGRLPMALNCPSPLYQLMRRCWSTADARPDFKFCLENIIALRKNIGDALLSPVDTI